MQTVKTIPRNVTDHLSQEGCSKEANPHEVTIPHAHQEKKLYHPITQAREHIYIHGSAHFIGDFLKLIWKCNLFFLLKTTHWLEKLATVTHRHWFQHLSSSILCSPFCRSGLEERPGITSSFSQSSSISNTWLGIFSGLRDLLKIQRKLLSTRNTIHNHHQQTKAK